MMDEIAKKLANDATIRNRTYKVLAKGSDYAHLAMAARLIGITPEDHSITELEQLCRQVLGAADNYSRIANTNIKPGSIVKICLPSKTITGKVTSIKSGGLVVVKKKVEKDTITISPADWESVKILKAA